MTPRTVALYPGAFRPPHANHLLVVEELLESVDEVRIIVSNRGRWVPAWDALLPPELGVQGWRLLLGDRFPTVSVQVAAGSGVAEALDIVQRSPGDRHYLLCVGEKDRGSGLGRFAKLREDLPPRVSAQVVAGAPPRLDCSASDLRAALGRADLETFAGGYGDVPGEVAARMWQLCHETVVSAEESARRSIVEALGVDGGALLRSLPSVGGPRRTFELADAGHPPTLVRYGNDIVSGRDTPGHARRDSVWIERNALQWVKKAARRSSVAVPEILGFDRSRATLAISRSLPGARRLTEAELSETQLADVGRRLGEFVAHTQADGVRLMRSRADKDQLAFAARVRGLLGQGELVDDVLGSRRRNFTHLGLGTRNVLVDYPRVAVIDFERASSEGDPVFDLATLSASVAVSRPDAAPVLLAAIAEGYRSVGNDGCCQVLRRLPIIADHLLATRTASPDGTLRELEVPPAPSGE